VIDVLVGGGVLGRLLWRHLVKTNALEPWVSLWRPDRHFCGAHDREMYDLIYSEDNVLDWRLLTNGRISLSR
jgi:hypothetical protein